jgi:hypothetical protein
MTSHEIISDDMQAVVISMSAGESLFLTFFRCADAVGKDRLQRPLPGQDHSNDVAEQRSAVKRDFGGTLGVLGDPIGGGS